MKIIIDVRERGLIQEFEKDNYEIEKKQLDIGDIIIYDENDKVRLLIERKTPSDIISSIKDGRYNEQSYRLSNYNLHNHNIVYLIEGNYRNHMSADTILSAMFSLYYSKGFSIWTSNNIQDTKNIICKMIKKMEKDKKDSFYEEKEIMNQPDYVDCVKMTKKENITSENIHQIMLAQIPNVSINISRLLLEKYKTLYELKKEIDNDSTSLNNIKYMDSKGKERKISSLTIKNIIKYL